MTQVLWPDQVRLQNQRLWTPSKDLVQEETDWYFVHRVNHREKQPKTCSRIMEPVSMGCPNPSSGETHFPEEVNYDSQTLTRKPLQAVAVRRPPLESSVPTFLKPGFHHKSELPSQSSVRLTSLRVRQSNHRLKNNSIKGPRTNRSQPASRELKALILANERWNENPCVNQSAMGHCPQRMFSASRNADYVKQDIRTNKPSEFENTDLKDYYTSNQADLCMDSAKEVIVPSWRTVETKRRYVIEKTENLGDEVFRLRHQKLELDERRRKRWDEQRQRDLELVERLHNRKDQMLNDTCAELSSSTSQISVKMSSIRVIEAEPVIAFGHFIASIPPREFSLPVSFLRQSRSAERDHRSLSPSSSRSRSRKVTTFHQPDNFMWRVGSA